MAVIYGWVLPIPGSGGLRDWSTFTTTFPGPNKGYIRAFQVEQCCPSTQPPLQTCDVFFNEGANIVVLRDLGNTEVLATGPSQYTDIAILTGKLYARKFTGYLDEYTIGSNSVTLTTPDITNLGTGTSLASDGTYLIYDISSGLNIGKIARTSPGTWTPTLFNLADPVTLQGDIMAVGGSQLIMSTFEDTSSILIIDNNPTTPIINVNTQIRDNIGNVLSQIYGMFQKDGILYIVRSDGTYYSMGTTWPITFQPQGQLVIGGDTFGDWNGAAQNGDCGTVVPPVATLIPFSASFESATSLPTVQLTSVTLESSTSFIPTAGGVDMTSGYSGSVADSLGPYTSTFTLDPSSPSINLRVYKTIDGGTEVLVDTVVLTPASTYNRTYSDSPTTSFNLRFNIDEHTTTPIALSVHFINEGIGAAPGLTFSNGAIQGATTGVIATLDPIDLSSPPVTQIMSGTGLPDVWTLKIEEGVIGERYVDISYIQDGGSEVFVETALLPESDVFARIFDGSTALTSFEILYKFKLPS